MYVVTAFINVTHPVGITRFGGKFTSPRFYFTNPSYVYCLCFEKQKC